MAQDSSLKDKVGCMPIIIMVVVVFALGILWQLRQPLLGIDDSFDWVAWMGLRAKQEEPAPPPPPKPEPEADIVVELINPPTEGEEGAGEKSEVETIGMGQDAGTAELNQAVVFEVTSPHGKVTKHKLPRGTIMEVMERKGDLLHISLMGRTGWLPVRAVREVPGGIPEAKEPAQPAPQPEAKPAAEPGEAPEEKPAADSSPEEPSAPEEAASTEPPA